jgi:DNA polymerase-3 subunit epsilon
MVCYILDTTHGIFTAQNNLTTSIQTFQRTMKLTDKSSAFTFPLQEEFVLMDIETTGVRPDKDRIIEINLAVIKNGVIQKQWHSLINPQKNNLPLARKKALAAAPVFQEIAAKLHKLLKNKMLVAHNAFFIYEFLKHEMLRSHTALDEKILCSISLSRFLFPESKQHHLEAINERLLVDYKDMSRLQLLINFFSQLEKMITPTDLQQTIKRLTQACNSAFVVEHKDGIPAAPGIYRFYDENNCLIYIGKSTSLSETIASHFQLNHHAHKEIQIAKQIKKIDWIKTSGELGNTLLASTHINRHKPLFNRLIEKMKTVFTIRLQNNGDYLALQIVKLSEITAREFATTFGIFKQKADAEKLLNFFINQSDLCHHINNFTKTKGACFRVKVKKCNGACNQLEPAKIYNSRIKKIIKTFPQNQWPFPHKIAIRETCEKTNDTHFHIIDNWTYIDTVKSLDKLNDSTFEPGKMDENIYKVLKNFFHKEENQQFIINIK